MKSFACVVSQLALPLGGFCVREFAVALGCVILTASTALGQLAALPSEPWPNDPVTISFAPDFVEIGRHRNELHQHLNGQLSFPDWQIEILKAFQAWARQCDLQVALAADSQRAFGVPGLAQGDPRFGDIRLGGFPQTNVLGNAVPFNFESGTWAGDIFIDTTREFYFHEWTSGQESDDRYDVFSVMLHEAGNSLGLLDEIADFDSVMFFAYVGPRWDLSALDVANIQSLYGPPSPDPYEMNRSNDSFESATEIFYGPDFEQTLVEAVPGRIQNASDIDVFCFQGTTLSENCWLKLRTRGRSLLCGRVTAYDSEFNEIATIAAEDPIFNSVGKEITNIGPDELIYVVVEWSGIPDFEFGAYELAVDFNQNAGAEFDGANDDDDDDQDRFFESDDEALVDGLFDSFGLIDLETSENNSFNTAVELLSPLGAPTGTRFEILSTLASATDRDVYRLVASPSASGTMAVDLTPLGQDASALSVLVFNGARKRLPARTYIKSNGDVAVEVDGIQAGAVHFLQVQARTASTVPGNYLLTAHVASRTSQLSPLQTLNLSSTNSDQFATFTTYKTQLFQFSIAMQSADSTNQATQLTIYSDTGRVELVTSVRSRRTRTAFAWLHAGTHFVRFSAQSRSNRPIANSVVTFSGGLVSDDEGPILVDPSGNPVSGTQEPDVQPPPQPDWQFPIVRILELVIPPLFPW